MPSKLEFCKIVELLLDYIDEAILIFDREFNLLFFNQNFKKFLKNFNKEQDSFKNLEDFLKIFPEFKKHFEEFEKQNFSKYTKEIELLGQEKSYFYILKLISIPEEEPFIFMLSLSDITKLKQLENVRKEFVANVSHELKTPLTAIKGYVETLLDGDLEDLNLARKFLEIIKNQTNRFILLVEDLLTLSRIEFKDIKIHKEWFSIEKIIEETFDIVKDKAQQKGLYLRKEISANPNIYSDPHRFSQILLNLVDNAVKFTKKGGVTVKFYKDGKQFVLEIKDTGIGIPKECLPKIGQRFFRVDPSRSRKRGGTGLGMAIVKHLVQLLGYSMKIESEVGKGTSVKIFIPEKQFLLSNS